MQIVYKDKALILQPKTKGKFKILIPINLVMNMKQLRKIMMAFCLMVVATLSANAQTMENVKIQGDHGLLDAVIQKPKMKDGEKVRVAIICHGFGSNKERPLLRTIADSLQAKGFASIRFDFNGCGKSEGKFEDMTVPNEIEDAKRVIAYAIQQPWAGDISLVGHSQGGVVASMVAGELKGSIRSIALCAPAAVLRDDALRGQLQGGTYDAGNIPEIVTVPGRNIKVGRNYCVSAQILPIYETALQYEGPVILVHGTADRIVPYTYSERYKNGYKNAKLCLLPGVDHSFTVKGSVERAASLVSNFLVRN